MTTFQKKAAAVLAVLLVFVLIVDTALYRALFVNPQSLQVTYKKLSSPKIPASMNQVSMIYISDLEYGEFGSAEQTQKVFDQISALHPDLFLFGGDVFSSSYEPTEEDRNQMISWFASIEAPLGKFAVWGEQDQTSEERMAVIQDLFSESQVEILDNTVRFIGNQSRDGIRLAAFGLDLNTENSLAGLSTDQFNLAVSHYPDNLLNDAVQTAPLDMALAGNAHGTQITWPIKGGYRSWPGSTELNRAEARSLPFSYYLTSGLGCINVNARMNAPVEIVYFLFSAE